MTLGRDLIMRGVRVKRLLVLTVVALATALTGVARADRVPANCNGNGVRVNLSRSVPQAVNGQTVTYSISISNNDDSSIGLIACDATNVLVDFYCPGPDGSPNLANPILVANLADLPPKPEGTVSTSLGSKTCTINVSAGVTDAAASVIAGQQVGDATHACTLTTPCPQGTLHDSTADHAFRSDKTLGVAVGTCVAKVDKQVSCDGGKTFHDVGLVTADEDGHTDVCFGWNAFTIGGTSMPAEAIQVRYAVANAGTADLLTCSITEGNAGFP